ncbi:MAG: hypothetical protein AB8B99_11990 [Phormidesmis sp.]
MGNRALQLLLDMEAQTKAYIEPYEKVRDLVCWAAVNKVGESTLEQKIGMILIASTFASTIYRASAFAIYSASTIAFAICSMCRASNIDSIDTIYSAIDSAIASTSAIDSARASAFDSASANASAFAIYRARSKASNASTSTFGETSETHHFLNRENMEIIADKLSAHEKITPKSHNSSESWLRWSGQLLTIWLETLELDKDDITFSVKEAKALQNYLYATELLIRCRESAIRVSRSEWTAMEKRLLTT